MTIPGRYVLVIWTFSLSVLLYVDRICMSTAKSAIAADLEFNDREMGWVLSIFALGYALFQTPGGWFADRFGPRISLSVLVIFWSVFTGLTAVVTNWWNMLLTRFLFGMGEAGAYPGVARVTYSWIPENERGFIQGINFSGSRIGGAFSLLLLPALIECLGWKGSFFALAGIGFFWASGWYWWFRNDPATHRRVTRQELERIVSRRPAIAESIADSEDESLAHERSDDSVVGRQSLTFRQLASSTDLWLISLQYFCSNFTFFFCLTWLFPHLTATYGLKGLEAGIYSATPLVCGAMGNWFSGWLVDRIHRMGKWNDSRRIPAILGFSLATAGLLGSVYSSTAVSSIAWFSLAIFGSDMTISPSWSFCIDIGQDSAGLVSGTMNMAGNIGSFITALAFPYLAQWTGSNTPFFFVAAGLNLMAIPVWMLVDVRRTLGGTR